MKLSELHAILALRGYRQVDSYESSDEYCSYTIEIWQPEGQNLTFAEGAINIRIRPEGQTWELIGYLEP